MANDFTDPSGSAGRELSALRKELESFRKRMDALVAADQKRASADTRGAPQSSRKSDVRGVRQATTKAETQQVVATETAATRAAKSRVAVTDELAARQARLAQAEKQVAGTTRTSIQQGNLASQELRRRGALTTEAITAAAQGTLTFRELGYQVGATIGKFAGWTLAAGFTFAAIDAVSKLGQGALAGADGVNQLSRVINGLDTSKANRQIRELAESANNDLTTVNTALFESGKVFGNQDDAGKLARVALRAGNIGEVETTDAVRFLTSIVRGFKLEAGDATEVLDIFNNLQQKFGTDIRGGLQGSAKAAASVLNSGGNLPQLAALVATIQRGGFSGSEAGVALQRSAELTKRPGGVNRARLAEFGIDSQDPFNEILEQAIALVESGKVKGPQINELATALSTPQLSPRFAAILNRTDQYRAIREQTVPAAARGSAEREEKKFLSSPIQQIKSIGVELQKLGASLGQAGVFDGLIVLVKALDLGLESAGRLLDVFNLLPKPLREAVVIAAELYAVTRLIRRFNPGDGVTPGRFGGVFQPNDNQKVAKFLRSDSRGEVAFFRNEQERAANAQRSQFLRRDTALAHANDTQARYGAAARGGDTAALAAVRKADDDALRETRAAERVKREYVAANQGLTRALSTQRAVESRLRNPLNSAGAVARSVGFSKLSPTINTPTDAQPGQVTPGGVFIPGGVVKPQKAVETQAKQTVLRSQQIRQSLKTATSSGTAFQRGMNLLGLGFRGVNAGIGGIPRAANRTGSLMASAGSRLGLAAASIGALLGPFEIAFLALIGIGAAIDAASQTAKLADQIKASRTQDLTKAQAKLQLDQAKETGGGVGGFFNDLYDRSKNLVTFSDEQGDFFVSDKQRNEDDAEQVYLQAKRREKRDKERRDRARQARALSRLGSSPDRYNPQAFDDTQLLGEIDALNTLGGLGRLGNKGIKDLTDAYIEALSRFAGSRNPKDIEKLAQAQQGFESALGGIQEKLELQLQLAGDDGGQRRSAYNDAKAEALKARRAARENIARRRRQLREAQREQREAARDERSFKQQDSPLISGGFGSISSKGVESRAKKKTRQAKKALSEADKALAAINKFIRTLLQDLAEAFSGSAEDQFSKFDEQTDLINQRAEVAASGTLNTGAQLSARLGAANQNLARARSLGSGPEAERRINDALIARNGIMQEFANLAVARLEAANAISIASAPTEQGRIRAEISAAQAKLALLRSQGRGSEETDVVVADIIRLQKDLQRQILDDARSLAEATAEYRKSLTGNPNREAKIEVNLARRLLDLAKKTEDPTERAIAVLQARARLNDARGQRTLGRFQDRYETVEYKARIGLIGSGQEYNVIQGLINSVTKKQLRTIDGMRDLVRSWKERLKALEAESEVEINPGSIRLPTFYDVRRIQRQGTNQAANGVVNQQNSYTFHTSSVGEAEVLGASLDRTQGTHTRAAMRAAGMI